MKRIHLLFCVLVLIAASLSNTSYAQVPVTGVTLDQSTVDLTLYHSVTLNATVNPTEATNKAVTWTSSLPDRIEVDQSGWVFAMKEGIATITATTADGNYSATCTVSCIVNSAANFMSFSVPGQQDINFSESTGQISIFLPTGSSVTGLTASYEISPGATISPDPATVTDYTNAVDYTITAQDGTIKTWTVSVQSIPDYSAYSPYTFQFNSADAPSGFYIGAASWIEGDFRLSIVSATGNDPASSTDGSAHKIGLHPARLYINGSISGKKINGAKIKVFENCGAGCSNVTFYTPGKSEVFGIAPSTKSVMYLKSDAPADSISIMSYESDFTEVTVWYEQGAQVNNRPVARAGADQNVADLTTVYLDGSASSDPDGDAITYQWNVDPTSGIPLKNQTTATPEFIVPQVIQSETFKIYLTVNDQQLTSYTDTVLIHVTHTNLPPVANAGFDRPAFESDTIYFNGANSSDPESDPLTYSWSTDSGVYLYDAQTSSPHIIIPYSNIDQTLKFSLTVSDGQLTSQPDTVIVSVSDINHRPIADASYDMTTEEGQLVVLLGHYSTDPDNDPLTYQWTAPANIVLDDVTAMRPSFTAPQVMQDSTLQFILEVSDGALVSSPDTVKIFVQNVNQAPVAQIVSAATFYGISCASKATVVLDGTPSYDPDGDALTYEWFIPKGFGFDDLTIAKPTLTAPEVTQTTTYGATLKVSDGVLASTTDFIISVEYNNQIPVANAGADQTVNENELVQLDGTASTDADGNTLSYQWSSKENLSLTNATTANPSFQTSYLKEETVYTFYLVVNDGFENSIADSVKITVADINHQPVANAGWSIKVSEGESATLDATESSDLDQDALSYQWIAPSMLQLDNETLANPTFVAPEVKKDTMVYFFLTVYDGLLYSEADTVEVFINNVNKAPVAAIQSASMTYYGVTLTEKDTLALDGTPSYDPDGDALIYEWIIPQAFTVIDPESATPQIVAPEVDKATTFEASLIVKDGRLTHLKSFIIIVSKQANRAPIADIKLPKTANEGEKVTLDGTGSSDRDGNTISYQWSGPEFIQFDDATLAQPSFTIPEISKDTLLVFHLTVYDGELYSETATGEILVFNANQAPVAQFQSTEMAFVGVSGNEGETITLNGASSYDPDGDALTFEWYVPSGFTLLNAESSTPKLVLPRVDATTSFNGTLKVYDGKLASTQDFIIQVKHVVIPNQAPIANAGSDISGQAGDVIQLDGSLSTDPEQKPLTYQWIAPETIVLSDVSSIMPTFTAPNVATETTFEVVLKVSDGELTSVADTVLITISPLKTMIHLTVKLNQQAISSNQFEPQFYHLVSSEWIIFHPEIYKSDNGSTYFMVEEGQYIVSVQPYTGNDFVTTFSGNTVNWSQAVAYTIAQGTTQEVEISCVIAASYTAGPAEICGIIYKTHSDKSAVISTTSQAGTPAQGITILLYTEDGTTLLASTITDVNGFFSFDKLPLGKYTLKIQMPGYDQDQLWPVQINAEDQDLAEINFYVNTDEQSITLSNIDQTLGLSIQYYPNPVIDQLTIQRMNDTDEPVILKIVTLTGKTVRSETLVQPTSTIDVSELIQGIYFIQCQEGKHQYINHKLIKR